MVQDNCEFNYVLISAPRGLGRRVGAAAGGSLHMSLSYRGNKRLIPDIDSLVVDIPEVKLPDEDSGEAALVTTWEVLPPPPLCLGFRVRV